MDRRALAAVGLGLLLLTAGCQAPTAPREPANITVENGTLAVDPGVVFADLQTVTGTNVVPPEQMTVYDSLEELRNGSAGGVGLPPFQRAVGLRTERVLNESEARRQFNGAASSLGTIIIYPGLNSTLDEQRLVVAHEFVHYIQFRTDRLSQLQGAVDASTTDGRYVVRAMLEGPAVYTTDAYLARFTANGTRNAPLYDSIAARYPDGHVARYGNSQYVEGHEYVASRVTDPTELPAVYAAPPNTSEQVIHNLSRTEEPPLALEASVSAPEGWQRAGTDRLGEAFVRTALAVGVSQDRASRAAAGWGNDRLLIYRTAERANASYAWTFAWDDRANATEFEAALEGYLDARGTRSGDRWNLDGGLTARVVSPSPRTTALLLGAEPFVGEASVRVAAG
jgi:hypothetical protein